MQSAWRQWADRLLGRGSAAITVPVMDGTLKPNRVLDDAEVVAQITGLDDVASDGRTLYATAGPVLYRLDGAALREVRRFDTAITALASAHDGPVAVALDGREVQLFAAADGPSIGRLDAAQGQPLRAANALAFDAERALLISDGSAHRGPDDWCRDLMELGSSGRVLHWSVAQGHSEELARSLRYSFGVLPFAGGVLCSESWQHRVLQLGAGTSKPLLAELPGYPSRLATASDGGFWLSCFVCRTQLVEFVLREDAYRQRMLAEIDPRYWIAPALSSGQSFLEPLQGAGVKQMGVLKPWAPPRSYGLVLKVARDGRIVESLHSQVDGKHHGITALAEHDGALYAVSKGSGRLLRVALEDGRRAERWAAPKPARTPSGGGPTNPSDRGAQ